MGQISHLSLHDRMMEIVVSHPAINNDFLTRFSKGEVTDVEFGRFATEFFHFSRTFPAILANLLVNTADEGEAFEVESFSKTLDDMTFRFAVPIRIGGAATPACS